MASFRKHKNGTWEYRIRYKDPITQKYKETSKRGFKTKKEAQLAAAQAEMEIDQLGFVGNGNELFKTYIYEWLETYKKPKVKPITYSVQERNVRLNILPRWGNYKLKQITRVEYQKWLNELIEKYSEGTVRRIHSIMNSALFDAVHEFRILRENPISKITIPKKDGDKKVNYFTFQFLIGTIQTFSNQRCA